MSIPAAYGFMEKILFYTGARVCEFVQLRVEDLHLALDPPNVYSKNPDRLLEGDIAGKFFAKVLEQARAAELLSDERFSVEGTLIEAWASHKSFQRKDCSANQEAKDDPGNPTVDFHGEKRSRVFLTKTRKVNFEVEDQSDLADLRIPENDRLRERDVSHLQRLSLRLEMRINSSIYQRLIFV